MIRFSILIPIYNRLNITKQGLKSLYEALGYYTRSGNSQCRFDVIVIDEGSTDGSSQWISDNYPDVYLLQGNGELWGRDATNVATRYAMETRQRYYRC